MLWHDVQLAVGGMLFGPRLHFTDIQLMSWSRTFFSAPLEVGITFTTLLSMKIHKKLSVSDYFLYVPELRFTKDPSTLQIACEKMYYELHCCLQGFHRIYWYQLDPQSGQWLGYNETHTLSPRQVLFNNSMLYTFTTY